MITRTLYEDLTTFVIYLSEVVLERDVLQITVVEIQNALSPSVTPPPEVLPLYEIMCKSMVEPDRPQVTVWRMRFPCWTIKAADTHLEYAILNCFSTATMVARTRLSVTLYVNCLSCLGLLLKLGKFLIYSSSSATRQLASDPGLFSS